MSSVSIKTLEEKKAGLKQGLIRIDRSIAELSSALERQRADRLANDGAIQVLNQLIEDAQKPAEKPGLPTVEQDKPKK